MSPAIDLGRFCRAGPAKTTTTLYVGLVPTSKITAWKCDRNYVATGQYLSNSSKVPFVCFNRLSDELVFSSLFQPERRDDIKFTLKSTLALKRERINYKVQEFVKFYESFCPVNVRNRHPFFVSNRLLSLYFPSASKTGFYFLVKLRKLTRARSFLENLDSHTKQKICYTTPRAKSRATEILLEWFPFSFRLWKRRRFSSRCINFAFSCSGQREGLDGVACSYAAVVRRAHAANWLKELAPEMPSSDAWFERRSVSWSASAQVDARRLFNPQPSSSPAVITKSSTELLLTQ